MAFRRPLIEEDPPMGVAPEFDNNGPGGVNDIIERPARDGLPEVIRIVDDDDEGNLPIHSSSDEEEDGEVKIAVGEGEVERHVLDDFVGRVLSDIEEEEEETEDSGYYSMHDDEEDDEDDNINLIIRPRASPIRRLQPPIFCQGFRRELSPVPLHVGGPFSLVPFGVRPAKRAQRPEEGRPSVCQRSEESAPFTSGLSCSTKRSREEDCTEQVSVKRRRDCEESCEESHEEPAPSTSGIGSSTNRSREEDYRCSLPSTSGFGFRRYWQRPPDDSDSDSD